MAYQRSALPPGETGLVKQPYQLADAQGPVRFGATMQGVAAEVWQGIIQADAINEYHEFLGSVETRLTDYEDKVASSPGATLQEYQQWQRDMLNDVKMAGGNAKTGTAKRRIRNWYSQNTAASENYPQGLLQARAQASLNAIQSKREAERANVLKETYIQTGEFDKLQDLYGQLSGKLIEPEIAGMMLRADNKKLLANVISRETAGMSQEQAVSYIDAANEVAQRQYGIEGDFFTPDDIADLKERYLDNQRLAGASIKAQSEQIESDLSARIVALNFSKPQTLGEVEAIQREIATNKLLDGTQIRELTHFLDSQTTNAGKSADENDSDALAEAYKTMTSTMNQKQKFTKMMSLKPKLKNTTVDGFIQDIYKPETVSNEIYKAYSQALTSLQTKGMFSSETTQNINLSVKAHDLLRMFAEQNPDATEEEYAKFFNRLIENQTSVWGMVTSKSWLNAFRKEKGEIRYSIPQNIEAMQKEIGMPTTSKQSAEISQPNTQAEFDALPKGTRYRRADGSIWVKR